MKHVAAKLGELVAVPIDESRSGVAQVVLVRRHSIICLAVFDYVGPAAAVDVDEAITSDVLLLGLSMDVLIRKGFWPRLGQRDPVPVTFPAFKVTGPDGGWYVTDVYGHMRPARPGEVERANLENTTAPIRFQKALQAHAGIGAWDDVYNKLRPPAPSALTSPVQADALVSVVLGVVGGRGGRGLVTILASSWLVT